MIKNAEILKGIDFNNLDEESIKKTLINKFSKNITLIILNELNFPGLSPPSSPDHLTRST